MTVLAMSGSVRSELDRRPQALRRGPLLAAACALVVSGCISEGGNVGFGPKHLVPIPTQTLALLETKGMAKQSPILLRIFKEESELEIWKQTTDGKYALLKTFPICRWSGELGPKIREGDRQAPEGFYAITPELMNPWSNYYLAFNLGYPNDFDRAHGRTGSHLMVHGDCSSRGCYSMTDEQISEIFALAREAFDGGQLAFQVHAFPFRMTARNLARHRENPNLAFWRMLKEGNDHFEITRQQPKIDVCEGRYLFNAHLVDPSQPIDARGKCPAYQVPAEIAGALKQKWEADERQFQVMARLLPAAPIVTGRDGGTHQAFLGGTSPTHAASAPITPVVPASTRTATGPVPVPPTDPRRPGEDFVRRALADKQGSPSRATPPESDKARAYTRDDSGDDPVAGTGLRNTQQPRALPGATPILSTGGFSSFQ